MMRKLFSGVVVFLLFLLPAYPQTSQTPEVFQVRGDVLAPVLIYQPMPKYPRPFFGRAKSGKVLVNLIVSTEGKPLRIHVSQSSNNPKIDKSATDCVAQYKFEPATKDGKPVTVELNVEVSYQVF